MRRAFTLVELLVVCGILLCLAGLILPAIQACRARARDATCISNLHDLYINSAIAERGGVIAHYRLDIADHRCPYRPEVDCMDCYQQEYENVTESSVVELIGLPSSDIEFITERAFVHNERAFAAYLDGSVRERKPPQVRR